MNPDSSFETAVRTTLEERADEVARHWLSQLQERLPERPRDIFPGPTLLNHVPGIIRRLAQAACGDVAETDSAFVRDEAARLAELRHTQGFGLSEILLEYQHLGDCVFAAVLQVAEAYPEPIPADRAMRVFVRIERALSVLGIVTTEVYHQRSGGIAEQRAAILARFGRSLMHELRNRLNSISLNLELLRDPSMDGEERTALLERTTQALFRLDAAMNDVLLIAMRPAGAAGSRVQRLDELIEATLSDVEDLAQDKRVTMRVEGDLPRVYVDAARTQLVLINLLTNAVKYRDPKKDESWLRVRVAPADGEREWRIEVADNGIGVPKGAEDWIFRPHTRSASEDSVDGDGLGLALAHDAVEQLEGRIWVKSTPGEGSVFCFTVKEPAADLPMPEPAAASAPVPARPRRPQAAPDSP